MCQENNWKIHKQVCAEWDLVEVAVERALATQPKVQAPKDAICYICLEGDGASSKLMRGCGCRGDSAGFVHLKCLTELAESKKDASKGIAAWIECINCKLQFEGALKLEITRRFWRRHRSSPDLVFRGGSVRCMALCLALFDERDAANYLFDEASKYTENDPLTLLNEQLSTAAGLMQNGQRLEAVALVTPLLPEAKSHAEHYIAAMTIMVGALTALGRNQEAYDIIREFVAYLKANCDPDDAQRLAALGLCAAHCAMLGRIEESKAMYEDVLTKQTRIFGPDHPMTQRTRGLMQYFSFLAEPTG